MSVIENKTISDQRDLAYIHLHNNLWISLKKKGFNLYVEDGKYLKA